MRSVDRISFTPRNARSTAGTSAQTSPPSTPASAPTSTSTGPDASRIDRIAAVDAAAPIASDPSLPTVKIPARRAGTTVSATRAIGTARTSVSAIS